MSSENIKIFFGAASTLDAAEDRGRSRVRWNLKDIDFSKLKNTEAEAIIAAALLAADFHLDNRKKNYKAKLEKMKQPGLLKRLFSPY